MGRIGYFWHLINIFIKFYLQLLRFVTFLGIIRKSQFHKILNKFQNREN